MDPSVVRAPLDTSEGTKGRLVCALVLVKMDESVEALNRG